MGTIRIFFALAVWSGIAGGVAGAVGQPLGGRMPQLASEAYVLIPEKGFTATQVHTRRLRPGTTEFIDLVNVFADSSFWLHQPNAALGNRFAFSDQLLMTMAVLPDAATGRVTWEPLATGALAAAQQVPIGAVLQDGYARLSAYRPGIIDFANATRRFDLRPVVRRDGQYWTTRNPVLTEYFVVSAQPRWFPTSTDAVTINYRARPFSPADLAALEQRLRAALPTEAARPNAAGEVAERLLLEKQEGATYTFWSLPPQVSDADLTATGVVALQFRPGIGVVSGKYPGYFGLGMDNGFNTFFDVISITPLSAK